MKTVRERQLEKEHEALKEKYSELEYKYNSICDQIKQNANDTRNSKVDLRNYAQDRGGPWH